MEKGDGGEKELIGAFIAASFFFLPRLESTLILPSIPNISDHVTLGWRTVGYIPFCLLRYLRGCGEYEALSSRYIVPAFIVRVHWSTVGRSWAESVHRLCAIWARGCLRCSRDFRTPLGESEMRCHGEGE
jgi:hypothetical protein